MHGKLAEADFERAYELIAAAIDRVGADHDRLFLGKLCLALTSQLGDVAALEEVIRVAEEDLDE